MNALDRRPKRIDPPQLEGWARQVQAVRVFDELISNTYRDTSPPLSLNSVWDNHRLRRALGSTERQRAERDAG